MSSSNRDSAQIVLEILCPPNQFETEECSRIRDLLAAALGSETGKQICHLKQQFDDSKSSIVGFKLRSNKALPASTPQSGPDHESHFEVKTALQNHAEIAAAVYVLAPATSASAPVVGPRPIFKKGFLLPLPAIEANFRLYDASASLELFKQLDGCDDEHFGATITEDIAAVHEVVVLEFPGPPQGRIVVIAPRFGGILKLHFDVNNGACDTETRVHRSKLLVELNAGVKGALQDKGHWSSKKSLAQTKLSSILKCVVDRLVALALRDMAISESCGGGVSPVMPLVSRVPDSTPVVLDDGPIEETKKAAGACFMIPDATRTWLTRLPGPFKVVIIVGKLRGGKSFLITQIMRQMYGHFRTNPNLQHLEQKFRVAFETSDAFQSFTQGAMMCSMPNPDDGGTILLVDSEGTFACERDKTYDVQLFSLIFSLAQVLLFNHGDGVLNNTETLESLELSVAVALRNAPKRSPQTTHSTTSISRKALLLLCRNSRLATKDSDDVFRRDYLKDAFRVPANNDTRGALKDTRAASLSEAIFGDVFSFVDCVHMAQPRPTKYLSLNLVDQNFCDFDADFQAPFRRFFRLIASRLGKDAPPLSLCGSTVQSGVQLLSVLDGLMSCVNDGKDIPSLDSAALLVQRNSQHAAERALVSQYLTDTAAFDLPMFEESLNFWCHQFVQQSKATYKESVKLVVNQSDFEASLEGLERGFAERADIKRRENRQLSRALTESTLVGSFAEFLRREGNLAMSTGRNVPKYVFDPVRDGNDNVHVDARSECHQALMVVLEAALMAHVRPRVSQSIIDAALVAFVLENVESHCRLVARQWADAKALCDQMKAHRAEVAILEAQQRANAAAQQHLRNELANSNNQLKEDIAKREAEQKKLEADAEALRLKLAQQEARQREVDAEQKRLQDENRLAQQKTEADLKKKIADLAAEQVRLKNIAEQAQRDAVAANNRANKGGSCFLPQAEVLMFDGTTKLIHSIVPGDELLGLHNRRVRVVFVDVTELGDRALIGLNGRQPRMTHDHPVYSAVKAVNGVNPDENIVQTELGLEPLLFGDAESAIALRHWPCAEQLAVGVSSFWSVKSSNCENDSALEGAETEQSQAPRQQVERLDSLQWLPSDIQVHPPSTLVYDIMTDTPSYCVDGVFVRSDFPAIFAYPQAALLIERLAMLAVHHPAISEIEVGDTKLAPKPSSFHLVAVEFQSALEAFVANRLQNNAKCKVTQVMNFCTCYHLDPTFDLLSDAVMTRADWAALLEPRYAAFASRITSDAKLAWAATRLWSVSLPLLQSLIKDWTATSGGGDSDSLSKKQFSDIEACVIRVARKAWAIGDSETSDIMQAKPQLHCIALADFDQNTVAPTVFNQNIEQFKEIVGSRMLGEVATFLGEKQTGKTAVLRQRAALKGYDVTNLSVMADGPKSLWLVWGVRSDSGDEVVDMYLKAPGLTGFGAAVAEQRLFLVAAFCSSFVLHFNRNTPAPDRAMVSKFQAAAQLVFGYLNEVDDDYENSETKDGDMQATIKEDDNVFKFLVYAPEDYENSEQRSELREVLESDLIADEVSNDDDDVTTLEDYSSNNDESTSSARISSVLEDPSFKQFRKFLTLPALAYVPVLVNSTLMNSQENDKGLVEIMYDIGTDRSGLHGKIVDRDTTLDALGLFPSLSVVQLRPPFPPGPWPAEAMLGFTGGETSEYVVDMESLMAIMSTHCSVGFHLSSGERLEARFWINMVEALLSDNLSRQVSYRCGQSPHAALLDIISTRADDDNGLIKDEVAGRVSSSTSRAVLREFKNKVNTATDVLRSYFERMEVLTCDGIESRFCDMAHAHIAWLVERTQPSRFTKYGNDIAASAQAEGLQFLDDKSCALRAHLAVLEEERADSFLSKHWIAMLPRIIDRLTAIQTNDNKGAVTDAIEPDLLITDLLTTIRASFERAFPLISSSPFQSDAIFARFLLKVSRQTLSLASTIDWSQRRINEMNKDENGSEDGITSVATMQSDLNHLSESIEAHAAYIAVLQTSSKQLTTEMDGHRRAVEQTHYFYQTVFAQHRSTIKAQREKLERGIVARTKALSLLLDPASQEMLEKAVGRDRACGDSTQTEAFVALIMASIEGSSNGANPELLDYVQDLISLTRAQLELNKHIENAAHVQHQVMTYVQHIADDSHRLNEQVHKIMEARRNGPWQVIMGACMGIVGGCLLGPFSLVGGALLSAGVSGTMMGLEGKSTWGDYFKGVSVSAAAGALGGGCGKIVSGQLSGLAGAHGSLGLLTANVASGMSSSVASTVTQNLCYGRLPTAEALGKSVVCGAVGGAVLTGAEVLVQTEAMQGLARTLEEELNLLGEHIATARTVVTDLVSSFAVAAVTGENVPDALRATLVASSLGLAYRAIGMHLTEVINKHGSKGEKDSYRKDKDDDNGSDAISNGEKSDNDEILNGGSREDDDNSKGSNPEKLNSESSKAGNSGGGDGGGGGGGDDDDDGDGRRSGGPGRSKGRDKGGKKNANKAIKESGNAEGAAVDVPITVSFAVDGSDSEEAVSVCNDTPTHDNKSSEGFWRKVELTGEYLQAFGTGGADFIEETAKGTVTLVLHPVDSACALADAITDPLILQRVKDHVIDRYSLLTSDQLTGPEKTRLLTRTAAEAITTLLPVAKMATVGKLSKANKLSKAQPLKLEALVKQGAGKSIKEIGDVGERNLQRILQHEGCQIHPTIKRNGTGIDILASKVDPKTGVKTFVIGESKVGKSQLKTTRYGRQMSTQWIGKHLKDLHSSNPGLVKEIYDSLKSGNKPETILYRPTPDNLRRFESLPTALDASEMLNTLKVLF